VHVFPPMGTPVLLYISLMNNVVLEKIDETPGVFSLDTQSLFCYSSVRHEHLLVFERVPIEEGAGNVCPNRYCYGRISYRVYYR
jgi:hypothetical protein